MWLLHLNLTHLFLVITTILLLPYTSALEQHEEVQFCELVLHDLENYLASSFCSSFAAIEDVTSHVPSLFEAATTTHIYPAPSCTDQQPTQSSYVNCCVEILSLTHTQSTDLFSQIGLPLQYLG